MQVTVVRAFRAALIVFGLLAAFGHAVSAETAGDPNDRIVIQETLLYAYAYAYDSKDCVGWANLFTTDAILDNGTSRLYGRDAILQWCNQRQRVVVGNIKTRHNMTNIVFDQLTADRAETRTYLILTWQRPGEPAPRVHDAFTYRDVIVKDEDGRWLFKERHADH